MRILKDFKIPNFKFPKLKMKNVENIDEVNVDYEELKKNHTEEKGKNKNYDQTNYKTIKEVFVRSQEKFADRTFILEKFNPKEAFKEITFKESLYMSFVITLGIIPSLSQSRGYSSGLAI